MNQSVSKVAAAGILLITQSPKMAGRDGLSSDQTSIDDTSNPSKFLLMRHFDRWDLPKGHAEPGESLRETALRETEEETGIPATQINLDADFEFSVTYLVTYQRHGNRQFEKTVTYFLGYIPRVTEIACTEHAGYEWCVWPPAGSIQAQTIDPLLAAVRQHLEPGRISP